MRVGCGRDQNLGVPAAMAVSNQREALAANGMLALPKWNYCFPHTLTTVKSVTVEPFPLVNTVAVLPSLETMTRSILTTFLPLL